MVLGASKHDADHALLLSRILRCFIVIEPPAKSEEFSIAVTEKPSALKVF